MWKSKTAMVIGFSLMALVCFGLAQAAHSAPRTMSASPTATAPLISWDAIGSLLTTLGGGSTVAAVVAFIQRNQVTLNSVTNAITSHLPGGKTAEDLIEVAEAVASYVAHKDDVNAQRRLVHFGSALTVV